MLEISMAVTIFHCMQRNIRTIRAYRPATWFIVCHNPFFGYRESSSNSCADPASVDRSGTGSPSSSLWSRLYASFEPMYR